MTFPLSPAIDLLNSVLCIFCAWKLHRSYLNDPGNQVIKFFATGYFFIIFAYVSFSLPRLIVPDNSLAIGVGFLIAHVFLFLSTAYFVKVTTFFFKSDVHKLFFWIFIILAAGALAIGVIRFQEPIYDSATGITNWNMDPLFSTVTSILFLLVLVPSSLFFFYQGIKTREKIVRIRSIWIAFGLALLLVAAATYYTATTQLLALVSDILSFSSFLSVFIGVYYKRTNPGTMPYTSEKNV